MHLLRLAFDIAIAAIAVYVAITFYKQYREETGPTCWQRALGAAKDSATILWSKFVLLLAGITGNLDTIADLVGAPEMKTYIDTALGNPKVVAGVMMGIAFITMWARLRPGSSDKVK